MYSSTTAGEGIVVLVAGLVDLEEDVRVLGRAPEHRVVGVQGPLPEGLQGVHVHHGLQLVIVPDLHLPDLVGGAEAVEEVEEGHPAGDGGEVGPQRPRSMTSWGLALHSMA